MHKDNTGANHLKTVLRFSGYFFILFVLFWYPLHPVFATTACTFERRDQSSKGLHWFVINNAEAGCSFENPYVDGVDYGDGGDNASNSAVLKIPAGKTLTITANQTIAADKVVVDGTVNLLATGAKIELNKPIWFTDLDQDGAAAYDTELEYSTMSASLTPPYGDLSSNKRAVRKYRLTTPAQDCDDADPANTICPTTPFDLTAGQFDRIKDTGGSSRNLDTYYQETGKDPALLGLWHLNEASGDVNDSSGNGYTGTAVGTTVVDGVMGNARSFNGTSEYISTSYDFSSTYSKSFTMSAWINVNSLSAFRPILGKLTANWEWNFYVNTDGNVYFMYYTTGGSHGTANGTTAGAGAGPFPITINQWHHVAVSYNGKTGNVYVDGVPGPAFTYTTTWQDRATNLAIGYTGYDPGAGAIKYFSGSMDEVALYGRSLTPDEIRFMAKRRPYGVYISDPLDMQVAKSKTFLQWTASGLKTGNGETLKDTANLTAQWNLNETSGATATNNAGSCTGTCNGTLTGFANTTGQDVAINSGWTADNKKWGAGALMFDGTDDYITVTSTDAIKFSESTSFSMEAWIKGADYSANRVILRKGAAAGYPYNYRLMVTSAGKLESLVGKDGSNYVQRVGNTVLRPGQWYHVVSVFNPNLSGASRIALYVNGITETYSAETSTGTLATITSDDALAIGRQGVTGDFRYFSGVIDSVRLYSRALGAAEILSNYNAANVEFQYRAGNSTDTNDGTWTAWGPTTTESTIDAMDQAYQYNTTDTNLIGYWPMDETSNGTAYDKKNTNNGTATGTTIVDGKFGKARSFGSGNQVTITGVPVTTTANQYNIVEFWMYWDGAAEGAQGIVTLNNGGGNGWSLLLYNKYFGINTQQGDITGFASYPMRNRWTHVAVVVKNGVAPSTSNTTVYINGKQKTLVNGAAGSPASVTSNGTFTLGGALSGIIDELRVYKAADDTERDAVLTLVKQHALQDGQEISSIGSSTINTSTTIKSEGTGSLQIDAGKPTTTKGTVGLYHMDETDSGDSSVKDTSGNANHGTPAGTTLVEGYLGKGKSFDGVSDVITLGSGTTFDFGTNGAFTVSGWIKPTTLVDYAAFVSKVVSGRGGTYSFMTVFMANGALLAENTTASAWVTICPAASVSNGRWQHVAFSYDGKIMTGYVNGTMCGSAAYGYTDNAAHDMTIGSWYSVNTNYDYNGLMDEIQIDNRALTNSEIAANYQSGIGQAISKTISSKDVSSASKILFDVASDKPGTALQVIAGNSAFANYEPDANTVGLWHFDEEKSVGYYIQDASGNNYHGTNLEIGTGQDGNCNTTGNITLTSSSCSGRSTADAGQTNITSLAKGSTMIAVGSTAVFSVGDELMIYAPRHTGTITTAGQYELHRINSFSVGNIVLEDPVRYTWSGYVVGTIYAFRVPNYNNLLVNSGHTMASAAFAGGAGYGLGGLLAMRALGTASIVGAINQSGKGLLGGIGGAANSAYSRSGESPLINPEPSVTYGCGAITSDRIGCDGYSSGGGGGGFTYASPYTWAGGLSSSAYGTTAAGGGGGGGAGSRRTSSYTGVGGGGGGGGNNGGGLGGGSCYSDSSYDADAGTDTASGAGGRSGVQAEKGWGGAGGGGSGYGEATLLTKLFLGSGGGGGGSALTGSGATNDCSAGAKGGDGGGVVYLSGNNVIVSGSITANSIDNPTELESQTCGGGGGGSGGSILVAANSTTLGTNLVNANQGLGRTKTSHIYSHGGNGAFGRVAVHYSDTYSGSTVYPSFSAYQEPKILPAKGVLGGAKYFNGATDYIKVPKIAIGTTATISFWANAIDYTNNPIPFSIQSANFTCGPDLYFVSNTIALNTCDGASNPFVNAGGNVTIPPANQWHYYATVLDGGASTAKLYIDGKYAGSATYKDPTGYGMEIGKLIGSTYYWKGLLDEVRVDSVTRTAAEITQAYEIGSRLHDVIVDFKAKIDTGSVESGTTSFGVDETAYGSSQKANHVFVGDKIILKENVGGTEYAAQGTVNSVTPATGAITVTWDAGQSFPTGGFTTSATIIKWQKEWMDVGNVPTAQRNTLTRLTFRPQQAGSLWIDNIKYGGPYLYNPTPNRITLSPSKRFIQVKAVYSSSDPAVTAALTKIEIAPGGALPAMTPTPTPIQD